MHMCVFYGVVSLAQRKPRHWCIKHWSGIGLRMDCFTGLVGKCMPQEKIWGLFPAFPSLSHQWLENWFSSSYPSQVTWKLVLQLYSSCYPSQSYQRLDNWYASCYPSQSYQWLDNWYSSGYPSQSYQRLDNWYASCYPSQLYEWLENWYSSSYPSQVTWKLVLQ